VPNLHLTVCRMAGSPPGYNLEFRERNLESYPPHTIEAISRREQSWRRRFARWPLRATTIDAAQIGRSQNAKMLVYGVVE
jgi:hypothetical protein